MSSSNRLPSFPPPSRSSAHSPGHVEGVESPAGAGAGVVDLHAPPDSVLEISPLTPKDRADLKYMLEIGVDWVALSFVQRASDIEEMEGEGDFRDWQGLSATLRAAGYDRTPKQCRERYQVRALRASRLYEEGFDDDI